MPAPDLPIPEAAAAIRDGSLTARDLTDAHLARIAALDPALHAFVAVTPDAARAAASEADRELAAGCDRGPLHGIPIALKDLIDVAGLPTACGSRLRSGAIAGSDAAIVTRLRAAGAVILGKLATYEFALVGPTFDGPAPPAVNPWSPDHVTGGSSSGSASAVAAGLVRTAIGTDTGGSIRSPAAYCGVVGLKPTRGRVPSAGVFPLSRSLDHVGPLAASVAEAAMTLDAIADPGREPAAGRLGRDIAGLRIAYARDWFAEDPERMPGILEEIDAAVSQLSLLGARIAEVSMPDYALFETAGSRILDAEAFAVHRETIASDPAAYGRAAFASLQRGAHKDAAELAKARRAATPAPPPARQRDLRPLRRARHRHDPDHRAARRTLPRGARRLDPDADAAVQRHRPPGPVGPRRLRLRSARGAAARRAGRRRGAHLPDRPRLRAVDRPRGAAPAGGPAGLRTDAEVRRGP